MHSPGSASRRATGVIDAIDIPFMPHPFAQDPRLIALVETTERITGPGKPFAIVTEDVLGESIPVFARRARNLREVLSEGAATQGSADAYIFSDGRRITYADLVNQVGSLARALAERYGIGPGDRVAVFAANGPEWLLTFWAVASLDAVLVAMNGWWTGTEMRNALELTVAEAAHRSTRSATPVSTATPASRRCSSSATSRA